VFAAARQRQLSRTVGRLLAGRLEATFLDADDYHSADAVAQMASGQPLSEAQREPWLERVSAAARTSSCSSSSLVLACSALRRTHRAALRRGLPPQLVLILLDLQEGPLRARLAARSHAFMPPSLLGSQLATLESAEGEEDVLTLCVGGEESAEETAERALRWLGSRR